MDRLSHFLFYVLFVLLPLSNASQIFLLLSLWYYIMDYCLKQSSGKKQKNKAHSLLIFSFSFSSNHFLRYYISPTSWYVNAPCFCALSDHSGKHRKSALEHEFQNRAHVSAICIWNNSRYETKTRTESLFSASKISRAYESTLFTNKPFAKWTLKTHTHARTCAHMHAHTHAYARIKSFSLTWQISLQ